MHRELHVKLSVPVCIVACKKRCARPFFFARCGNSRAVAKIYCRRKLFCAKSWRGVLWAVTGLGGAVPCPSALPRGWTKLRSEGAENKCLRSLRRIQRCPPTFDARGPRFYHVLERFLEKSWRQRVFRRELQRTEFLVSQRVENLRGGNIVSPMAQRARWQ